MMYNLDSLASDVSRSLSSSSGPLFKLIESVVNRNNAQTELFKAQTEEIRNGRTL